MSDERSHLLAQVPLTVSPFLHLPKPPTLPHNYTSLPSTLPPSITTSNIDPSDPDQKPQYITSSSGFSAHPSNIISQNRALLSQLTNAPQDAQRKIEEWEKGIRERELAERRRRAPGWLDRDEKILQPDRVLSPSHDETVKRNKGPEQDLLGADTNSTGPMMARDDRGADLGAQMDRAFGSLG